SHRGPSRGCGRARARDGTVGSIMAHRFERLGLLHALCLLAACGDDAVGASTDGSSGSTGASTSRPGSTSLPADTTDGMTGSATGTSSGTTESLDDTTGTSSGTTESLD